MPVQGKSRDRDGIYHAQFDIAACRQTQRLVRNEHAKRGLEFVRKQR
jgi:hypothetical protein